MNGFGVALLVVLGASTSPRLADLQVEAVTAAGAELPELAEAVARVLVAGGARVVLRGPGSGPCEQCAKVEVKEIGPGVYRVALRNRGRASSTTLRLPAGSQLFDRAHAIAIQTRMLMSAGLPPEGRPVAARPARGTEVGAESRPWPATAAPAPLPSPAPEPLPGPDRGLAQSPAIAPVAAEPQPPPPIPATRRETPATSPASEAAPVDQVAARPADRLAAKPAGRASDKAARREAKTAPGVDLAAAGGATPERRWPWIPTAVGAGAAVAAGICAVVARDRYNGLADKSQSYASAQGLKSQGEGWQIASFVLAGVAVVGIGTGIVGFSTRSSSSPSVAALVSPVPGGGMVAVAGDLP